jgi:heptosyltransferase-2
MKKILVTRTDRIGDVVLSTPVFKSLKGSFPSMSVSVLVRGYTQDIVTDNPCVDEIILFDPEGKHRTINGILRLAEEIKGKKFDTALLLFLDFKIGLLSFLSRIPQRIGPATKLAQIFLTNTLLQHRSKVDRHEVDYNLDLAEVLGAKPIRQSEIYIPDEIIKRVNDIFSELRTPIVGIQPGSGGSARNWRPERYGELANKIIYETGATTFIIGGPGEEGLVDRVADKGDYKGRVLKYIGYHGLKELAGVISKFSVMVGPSTGPVHIASAVGTPVVSLYCPIFVCQPKRWGPIGENDIAITPDVPFCKKCIFERCKYYDCMDRIGVDRVFEEVLKKLWVR